MIRKRTKKKSHRKKSIARLRQLIFMLSLIGLYFGIYYHYTSYDHNNGKSELLKSIPKGFISFGIDVSHHQGKVNWKELFYYYQLDSVITFVYCKATEGNDHIDSQWENNRKTLLELGKANGAYHFLTNQSDPESQAKHFLTYWKKENNDLPPVLDVEVEFPNDKALISSMKSWLSVVEKQTGMRPVIYTSLHFYETKFQHEFKSFNFWIASYSRRPPCLDDPRILHWQYSEKGVLPGIRENVDFSVSKISFL